LSLSNDVLDAEAGGDSSVRGSVSSLNLSPGKVGRSGRAPNRIRVALDGSVATLVGIAFLPVSPLVGDGDEGVSSTEMSIKSRGPKTGAEEGLGGASRSSGGRRPLKSILERRLTSANRVRLIIDFADFAPNVPFLLL